MAPATSKSPGRTGVALSPVLEGEDDGDEVHPGLCQVVFVAGWVTGPVYDVSTGLVETVVAPTPWPNA